MSFPFPRVALVGFGLMGGSLARAMKALPDAPLLTGYSKDPQELEAGVEAGLLDAAWEDPTKGLSDQDLLLFATPPTVTLDLLDQYAQELPEGSTITEVVSLNAPFLKRGQELGLESRCVASHPMAGGTGTGFSSSRDGLFQGARVWVSPGGAEPGLVSGVEVFWKALGADPRRMDAQAHDEMMAWVSHLPQLLGNALADTLCDEGIPPDSLGPGGRDATRLAGSGPEMWGEILSRDSVALLEGLDALGSSIARIRGLLAEGKVQEIEALMVKTRRWLEGEQ